MIALKQFEDLRQLRAASGRGQAWGVRCRNFGSSPPDDFRISRGDLHAFATAFPRVIRSRAVVDGDRPDARGRELQRKGLAGLLVLPPHRRSRLRLDLLREATVN